VPFTLSIRIDPECFTFLNQVQYEKNVSARQNTFLERINDLHATVNQLKKQTGLQFDEKQIKEISRSGFYALTHSLEKKFTQQPPITLLDLQSILHREFCIKDETSIDFIIMSLLEPNSLPFALSTLAYAVRTDESIWSNACTALDSKFKYALKAKSDPSKANIIFTMKLDLKNINSSQNSPQGSATIQFMVNPQKQIKLLPLDMEFKFIAKKGLKQFKKELYRDFQDWIFLDTFHWQTTDLWVIPTLIGSFLGLIAMMSLLALSLTPISPLLLPPLGLALGLGLASIMHSYVHMSIKKEQEKLLRPIHIFNKKPMQTTAFFNHPDKITVMASECRLPRATRSQ
jgi:hypothetical protein